MAAALCSDLHFLLCFLLFSSRGKNSLIYCIYQVHFQWRLDGVHGRTLMFRSDADNKIQVGYTFLWLCDLPDTTPLLAGASGKQAQAWALACCPVCTPCSAWCCYASCLAEKRNHIKTRSHQKNNTSQIRLLWFYHIVSGWGWRLTVGCVGRAHCPAQAVHKVPF